MKAKEARGTVMTRNWDRGSKHMWLRMNCDKVFLLERLQNRSISSCPSNHVKNDFASPLIAVMVGSTSRKIDKPHVHKLTLFTYTLPTLIRTIDCGFRYVVVLGYDIGDVFYDSHMVR